MASTASVVPFGPLRPPGCFFIRSIKGLSKSTQSRVRRQASLGITGEFRSLRSGAERKVTPSLTYGASDDLKPATGLVTMFIAER